MNIEHFQLQTPERVIFCRAFLPEGAPERVILGVHGFAGDKDSSVLKKLAQALCAEQGALICFDFPAHGESQAPDSQLRVENCRADFLTVAEFIRNTYPAKQYGIFATSFGGYIALLCAEQIPDFRMVLRAPAVTMAESFIEKIIPCTRAEFLAAGGAWCGFERKMFVSRDFYQDLLENPPRIPDRPLMVIHGKRDDIIPYTAAAAIGAENPRVRLVTFANADHRFKNPGEIEGIVEQAMDWFSGR